MKYIPLALGSAVVTVLAALGVWALVLIARSAYDERRWWDP